MLAQCGDWQQRPEHFFAHPSCHLGGIGTTKSSYYVPLLVMLPGYLGDAPGFAFVFFRMVSVRSQGSAVPALPSPATEPRHRPPAAAS